jgi:predicted transcriptional regulator of viral defense system
MTKLTEAISSILKKTSLPVITKYDLEVIIYDLYCQQYYENQFLYLRKTVPEKSDIARNISDLKKTGVVAKDHDLTGHIFRVLEVTDGSPEEIIAIVDPFASISHLSAMNWHGFTDRIARELQIVSPTKEIWKELAAKKAANEFSKNKYLDEPEIPKRPNYKLPAKIRGRDIALRRISRIVDATTPSGARINISTIGETFLQTLESSDLCGGMSHVLEIWDDYAVQNCDEIVKKIERAGSRIVKMRAGYILTERLHLSNKIIDTWAELAMRGGSQKLDPSSDYVSEYSERWSISINA